MTTIKQKLIDSGWHDYQANMFLSELANIACMDEVTFDEIIEYMKECRKEKEQLI